jgi:two-component system, chemotaxis family, chemotaxis protein CheY
MPPETIPRVLVVNDDIHLARSVHDLLASEGYETRIASDGGAALQELARWPADLVLLDLIMPGMDGWEFLERRAANPDVVRAVVLVWSVAEPSDLERARELGAAECLPRAATTPGMLLATVARLLGGRAPTDISSNS